MSKELIPVRVAQGYLEICAGHRIIRVKLDAFVPPSPGCAQGAGATDGHSAEDGAARTIRELVLR